jgi:hypothetical protein
LINSVIGDECFVEKKFFLNLYQTYTGTFESFNFGRRIKLKLDPYAISQLSKNPDVEFKSTLNRSTGELDQSRNWSQNGMKINIKSTGYGVLYGSLHMFKNGGKHNYDDFRWCQVFQAMDDLSDALGLEVRHLKLINLEWGVNIKTEIPPKDILSGLVMHKGVRFEKMYVSPGAHYVCTHAQFSVKVYDKGSQHRLPENILRIEMAANRSLFINKLGISTLNDLQYQETRANLQNSLLLGGWNDSILIEPGLFHFIPLDKKARKRISNWSNPIYWTESPNYTRCSQRKKYDQFRHSNGFETKEKIFQAISEKYRQL